MIWVMREKKRAIMIQTLIGEVSMKAKFIKLFDDRIANALSDGGFAYIEEKVNGSQTVYCFEESPQLAEAIRSFCDKGNYQETLIIVQDGSLFF